MEFFAFIGLLALLGVLLLLGGGWGMMIEEAYDERKDAIWNEDEKNKVIATRKLFLWAFMPVIFPFVLLYLLVKVIVGWIISLIRVAKDLQIGKSVDKIEDKKVRVNATLADLD